jgi:two-component system chemotaxis response regulator CheY
MTSEAEMKGTLLIVEDDQEIRDALVDILTDEGYRVHAVENGKDALEYLGTAQELPSLIILDMMMPVMDGYEFLQRKAADGRISAIPTVLCSADGQIKQKAEKAGMGEWLRKPIELNTLLELAERHCGQTTSAS